MFKLQIKTKYGFDDVINTITKKVIYFDTTKEAVTWRIKRLGIGSQNYTRILEVSKNIDRKQKNLFEF